MDSCLSDMHAFLQLNKMLIFKTATETIKITIATLILIRLTHSKLKIIIAHAVRRMNATISHILLFVMPAKNEAPPNISQISAQKNTISFLEFEFKLRIIHLQLINLALLLKILLS